MTQIYERSKGDCGTVPETLWGSSQRSHGGLGGDTCYLTASVCVCVMDSWERAGQGPLDTVEELNGTVVFNIGSKAMNPQNEQT